MSMKALNIVSVGAVLLLAANVNSLAAAELKISGAPAVAIPVIAPNKAAIEKETGLTLNMTANNEVNGLNDLNAGKVDVAMLASPIKLTVAMMNKANPGAINEASFEVAPVGTLALKFIVNPANPVKSLTESQLKDIFTGKITSWKDVGGADQPILLVAEVAGFPARADLEAFFLGTEVNDKARLVQSVVQVAQVVAKRRTPSATATLRASDRRLCSARGDSDAAERGGARSVQTASTESVKAIEAIATTINRVNDIAAMIASAVEQQGAATQEIARNVHQAAKGTNEVSSNIGNVSQAASETGSAATQVLGAAVELSQQSEKLRGQVDMLLASIRAA